MSEVYISCPYRKFMRRRLGRIHNRPAAYVTYPFLHGVLVGILANVLYVALIVVPFNLLRGQSVSHVLQSIPRLIYAVITEIFTWLKILGAAAGAYVGGRRRKKLLSMQDSKV